MGRSVRTALTATALALLAGCATDPPAPAATRLVDRYDEAHVSGSTTERAIEIPRTEWKFDGSLPAPDTVAATFGWSAHNVEDFGVEEGWLRGVSTDDIPLLWVDTREMHGAEAIWHAVGEDLLHAFEIKLRVSAGSNVYFSWRTQAALDPEEIVERGREGPWSNGTPVVAGEESRTYTWKPPNAWSVKDRKFLVIRPSDVAGARFEIESIRLVHRREHLAAIPSGIGWQGLAGRYQETLVARAPETLRFPLSIPQRAWLDLSIGTIEEGALTFRVQAEIEGRTKALLTKTITTSNRWERTPIDLSGYGGQDVTLALSLLSEHEGMIGFWGTPAIRVDGAEPESTAPHERRNVILIIGDTLRPDHLGPFGHERDTAPVLQQLADEGTRFEACYAQGTWTKVSVPSILTSIYPRVHGIKEVPDRLPGTVQRLPDVFRDAGYATLGTSSVYFNGQLTNLQKGWEEFHEAASLQSEEYRNKNTREYVDRLLPWLEQHRRVPFLVMLHVFDPHSPYEPRGPYDALWADGGEREVQEDRLQKVKDDSTRTPRHRNRKNFGMPNADDLARVGVDADSFVTHNRDWYDGSIRGMDVEIGRLLEGLDNLGLSDNTLIVFLSDHGEEFLEHGATFHGQSVYSELARVPMLFWGPGVVPAGKVVDQPVQTIDMMPTLLSLAGLPAPEGMFGTDLTPLMTGRESEWTPRAVVTECAATEGYIGISPKGVAQIGFLSEGWKLVRTHLVEGDETTYELFDHAADPLDLVDVADERPEIRDRLIAQLEDWETEMAPHREGFASASEAALSSEELERLRALGYVD